LRNGAWWRSTGLGKTSRAGGRREDRHL
jgi:hypothetical protein